MLLNPVLYAIYQFNGVRPLARAINVDQAFIHRWRKKGLIPSPYQVKIIDAAIMDHIPIREKEVIRGGRVPIDRIKKSHPWMMKELMRFS
jgi:hypothetical protein